MDDKLKRQFEPETGDGLVSETLGIPLLWRAEPSTQLLETSKDSFLGIPSIIPDARPLSGLVDWKPFSGLMEGTISERLKIPVLIGDKPWSGLFHGTISSRLGIPELLGRRNGK